MTEFRAARFSGTLLLAAALAVGLLHVLGAMQVRQHVYRGYRTDGNRVVVEVARDGPAALAGMRIGDHILRIDGIDAGDRPALDARPRPKAGQTEVLAIDRAGRSLEVRITLTRLPTVDVVAYLASGLTGLGFLIFGLWAYFRVPSKTTTLLATAGIGIAALFTEMPYMASALARAIQEAALIVAGLFGFALLLHLMLVFPRERSFLRRRAVILALYAPAIVLSAGVLGGTALKGAQSGGPASVTTLLSLVLVLCYFSLAIVALVQGYVTATRRERSAWGLNLLVVCLILGLAPMVPMAIWLVDPGVVLPGSD